MKAQIVSFHCVLKDRLGRVIGSSFNREVINQLEEGKVALRGLVAGMQNVTEGERRQIYVSADQAYGLYDPKLVVEVPRKDLSRGNNLGVGNEVLTQGISDGRERAFRVINAAEDYVVLDGNHPLAGQDLIFEVEITSARDALDEDLFEPDCQEQEKLVH